jgi:phosphopantetheinyl transferase (holo-ACP synthase)
MIGNDIVDLHLARQESNWQRKGFLDKIFTQKEQNFILNSDNQETVVWKLWTCKEAVYKIWNRNSGCRKFNPKLFECCKINDDCSIVTIDNQLYFSRTTVTKDFIYSIAVTNIPQFQEIKHIPRKKIMKENELPFLKKSDGSKHIVSTTNHGRFEKIITI